MSTLSGLPLAQLDAILPSLMIPAVPTRKLRLMGALLLVQCTGSMTSVQSLWQALNVEHVQVAERSWQLGDLVANACSTRRDLQPQPTMAAHKRILTPQDAIPCNVTQRAEGHASLYVQHRISLCIHIVS